MKREPVMKEKGRFAGSKVRKKASYKKVRR